ncbi:hypothetical protein [Helicobacter sp. MIT 01-3238]|nr:hypothetical protein [Helicobacter sp. MIT 01-3238]
MPRLRTFARNLAMTNNQLVMNKDLPTPKPPPQREGAFKEANQISL